MRRLAPVILLLVLTASVQAGSKVPLISVINQAKPGYPVSLSPHLVKGRYTIVEFYSDHCPPCREIGPLLGRLVAGKENLVVRRIDIDRAGATQIDWDSPVARKYRIQRVPTFRVYGPDCKLLLQGDEARDQVVKWMRESGLVR